jgi:membrane-associated phospholipid phosphatase
MPIRTTMGAPRLDFETWESNEPKRARVVLELSEGPKASKTPNYANDLQNDVLFIEAIRSRRLASLDTVRSSRNISLAHKTAVLVLMLALTFSAPAYSQNNGTTLPDAPQPQVQSKDDTNPPVTLHSVPRNILHDQIAIWTSPAHINESNAIVPVALVLGTTLAITTDHQVMSSSKLQNASLNSHASTASDGLVGGFIAAPVLIYGMGYIHHDEHATETGILGGEAILDSIGVNEVLKIVAQRERPTVDNARGKFFQTSVGFNSSFPSNHAIIAWSSAAVIASEYKGPLTQITAYGLATGVSLTRILARQHFPSDVLVGSAVGWLIGRYVVHHHHHSY